jgi:hypothetical protein
MTRPVVPPDWATDATFPAGARPWNGQPNKTQPSSGKIGTGFLPENPQFADETNWILNNHAAWINYHDLLLAMGLFGSGVDGAADLDGINTYPWATLTAGTTYSLDRDVALTDLTIRAGITLTTNGGVGEHRIYGTGLLTVESGGFIKSPVGASGSGPSPLPTGSAATIGVGTAGGAGQINNGSAGTNAVSAMGGAGGAGGHGTSGSGGAGGTATGPANNLGRSANSFGFFMGHVLGGVTGTSTSTMLVGGAGGGGGSGDGASRLGGAGGAGGGVIAIAFRSILLASAGAIVAAGSPGLQALVANGGGGGGGGGGYIRIVCVDMTITSGALSAATNCPGGAGGAANGGGTTAGSVGGNGTIEVVEFATGAASPSTTAHEEEGFISVNTSDTTVTATFNAAFTAAPPSAGGYVFNYTIMRTDGVIGTPATVVSNGFDTTHVDIQIIDPFQGVICWRASVK